MSQSVYIKVGALRGRVVTQSWWWPVLNLFSPRTGAIAIYRTIYLKRSVQKTLRDFPNKRAMAAALGYLMAHEWAHLRQWDERPYTFLFAYIGQVVAGTWYFMRYAAYSEWLSLHHPTWKRVVRTIAEAFRLPTHIRKAYKGCAIEQEANTYARRNATAWSKRLDRLP